MSRDIAPVSSITGSLRYNKGKPELSQLPPEFLIELAALMTECSKKYKKWNYALGQPYTMAYDSMMRHILAFMSGDDKDRESGFSHLTHIAANALIMWCTQNYHVKNVPELDDRFNVVLNVTKEG